jgi:hypothetical protein
MTSVKNMSPSELREFLEDPENVELIPDDELDAVLATLDIDGDHALRTIADAISAELVRDAACGSGGAMSSSGCENVQTCSASASYTSDSAPNVLCATCNTLPSGTCANYAMAQILADVVVQSFYSCILTHLDMDHCTGYSSCNGSTVWNACGNLTHPDINTVSTLTACNQSFHNGCSGSTVWGNSHYPYTCNGSTVWNNNQDVIVGPVVQHGITGNTASAGISVAGPVMQNGITGNAVSEGVSVTSPSVKEGQEGETGPGETDLIELIKGGAIAYYQTKGRHVA